jgi:hypothetical protein
MKHIGELRAGAELAEKRFAAGCSMARCNANCCAGGVFADPSERDEILKHADLVRSHMDPAQERDVSRWFEKEEMEDADYPSGRAVGTEVYGGRCVFLNSNGMCVLQLAANAAGMERYALKPFYCWLYPVTVEHGELTLHDPEYAARPECCSCADEGPLTVFDVCAEELRIALGDEGLEELRGMMPAAVRGK